MPRSILTESRPAARVTATEARSGRLRIELATPGWGSSGYYSAEVLEAAGAAQVFPAGTHMYLDHPRQSDTVDLPERSVRDLAAVLTETAVWDPSAGDGTGALVAETAVFGPYRELLADEAFAAAIGVSLRALAEVVENGEAEGRRGRIITELVEARSVDFVTRAGRGGRITEILESAGAQLVEERRNVGQWIESRLHRDFTIIADDMAGDGRLTREERISLSSAIGDALTSFVGRLESDQPQLYTRDLWDDPADTVATAMESHRRGYRVPASEATANDRREQLDTAVRELYAAGEDEWAWVRDFDETDDGNTVWFERGGSTVGTFAQAYTTADDDSSVQLTGDPTEVAVRTTYVPVDPAGRTTEESEEDTMPQIEEARLRQLEEASGRVPTLESERDAATERATAAEAERDGARTELAQERARSAAVTHARTRVTEANSGLAAAVVDRIVATATTTVALTESGQLDTAALDTAVDAARTAEEAYVASIAESAGAGLPRGFGRPPIEKGEVSESDVDAEIARRAGTTEKEAS